MLVGSLDLSKQILARGCNLRIRSVGTCMYPFLQTGSIIKVKSVNQNDIYIGDIILFWVGEKMMAHRLVRKYIYNSKTILITKGDTSTCFDKPINFENVLGKVIEIEKAKKKIIKLDCKTWYRINYLIAMYSLATGSIIREKNNRFANVFRFSILVLSMLFIYSITFSQNFKFKLTLILYPSSPLHQECALENKTIR